MELKDIESSAAAHARGDNPNLGTRTIASWIACIAKALLEHAGSVQAHGLFEVRNAIGADARTSAAKLGEIEARVNAAIASLTKPQIIEQGHVMTLGHVEGSRVNPDALRIDSLERERNTTNRRISQLIAENAAEEKRHAVTQAQLDKFTSACADQTLQIAELRAEVKFAHAVSAADCIAELTAKCRRLEEQLAQRPSATTVQSLSVELERERQQRDSASRNIAVLRPHVPSGPHGPDVTVLREAGELLRNSVNPTWLDSKIKPLRDVVLNGNTMSLEALIAEAIDEIHAPCPDCADMAKQLEDRGEQLAVADGDRVPLAMDLENAQAELKEAKEFAGRMQPVIKAAVKTQGLWFGQDLTKPVTSPLIAALCEQSEALKEYETACAQAANAEDDIAF